MIYYFIFRKKTYLVTKKFLYGKKIPTNSMTPTVIMFQIKYEVS